MKRATKRRPAPPTVDELEGMLGRCMQSYAQSIMPALNALAAQLQRPGPAASQIAADVGLVLRTKLMRIFDGPHGDRQDRLDRVMNLAGLEARRGAVLAAHGYTWVRIDQVREVIDVVTRTP